MGMAKKRRRRFHDYTGGQPVDPEIVEAGHAAYEPAVAVAAVALPAVHGGDHVAASAAVTAFLLGSARAVTRVGRFNALVSVLLGLATQAVGERGGGGDVVVTLVAEPGASPARRAALTAIGYAAAGDSAAALDVLIAYKKVARGRRDLGHQIELVGELLRITATLLAGPVDVVVEPWPDGDPS